MHTLELATRLEPYAHAVYLITWWEGRIAGIVYNMSQLTRRQRADLATISIMHRFCLNFQ